VTDFSDELDETTTLPKLAHPEPAPTAAVFTPVTQSAPQKAFGARFDPMAAAEISEIVPPPSGTNGFLIATGVAALLVAAVAGAFYFHVLPGAKSNLRSESAPPAVNVPATYANSSVAPATAAPAANAGLAPTAQIPPQAISSSLSPAPAPAFSVRAGEPAAANHPQPASTANQKPLKPIPDISGTLTAHPVSAQRTASGDAGSAPSVDGGESAAGELQQMSSGAELALPPAPPAPVKRGGDVQAPKLVSSVMPIYPTMAKSSGITGNVVIEVSISATGAVVATKVLSGPPVLRQAAVDALRRWKYRPATLNGVPSAVDITVTMAFHNN
jgi:protein TonB